MPDLPEALVPLTCPHGFDVQIGMQDGIVHYDHPDGAPCLLLNRFDVKASDIISAMSDVSSDPAIFFAGFVASRDFRYRWYLYLSQCDLPHLIRALKQTEFLRRLPVGTGFIAKEIHMIFGEVFWENLREVNPNVAKSFVMGGAISNVFPDVLPMVSIKDDKVTNMQRDIDAAVKGLKNRGVIQGRRW